VASITGAEVSAWLGDLLRQHPRWECETDPGGVTEEPAGRVTIPSISTLNRVLVRQGLVVQRKRKRPKESYQRRQRPAPMQLWQPDIVGGDAGRLGHPG
jgi:hypothetical protein